jgi:iron(III) transport system ATP-binding protein
MAFGLTLRKFPRAEIERRVNNAARILDITPLLARKPKALSGGQRQRVAMGRAIVRDPKVFLFDEPLSNLDAKLRVQMRTEIKKVHQTVRTTTVYVTHDQVEAMTLADRVVVMNHGVIDQVGTPLEVYERAATPFVADFLGRINALDAECLGGGRYRVGAVELQTAANGGEAGKRVKLYLRPEDRHVEGDAAHSPQALRGRVQRIDFLGTFCLAEVHADALGQPVTLYYSLNQLHDLAIREGAQVSFMLRGERARVFAPMAAA